jgi:hypothetical protein
MTALITTEGGAMVGYCSIGRLKAAIPPASMTTGDDPGEYGPSMKKRDSDISAPPLVF